MRKRVVQWDPSPGSIEIEVSGKKIRFLPGHIVAAAAGGSLDVSARLKRAMGESDLSPEGYHRGTIVCALVAFLLWDDPHIEWATTLDADDLLRASDEQTLAAGIELTREMLSLKSVRLLASEDLAQAALKALQYVPEPPTGEVEPLE